MGHIEKEKNGISFEELKLKGRKGIQTVIYGRTLFVVLAFAVQIALMLSFYLYLREYSIFMHGLFAVLGTFVVLHLFNGGENPDFKVVWMLPILIFPVFGAMLYLFVRMQPGTRLMKKRLSALSEQTKRYVLQEKETFDALEREDSRTARFAGYMYRYGSCPVYDGTQAVYYPLGDLWFPAMMEELEKAEKFIFLEYFIVEEGVLWNAVLSVLKRKAKEGVEVRFLYDGTCALALLPYFYPRLLQEDGIKCKMFSPIKPVLSSHYNNRDHRKILVVDGRTAFTGGTNLADEYINQKKRFGHWKDTAVMLRGKAVEKFTYLFLEMWNVDEKQPEDYGRYRSPENGAAQDGYFIPYGVSPFGEERIGKRVYLDILNTARRYVHIMTPYLILDYETMMALIYAAKRGIDVTIVMPHIPDKKPIFWLAKTYYNELLDAGISIYEYTPGFVHAKVFVSDDEKAVVGTVNLDYRSLYHHFECGVMLYKSSEIAAIEADFQETLMKCEAVSKEDYARQNLCKRIIGKAFRLFAPLL